MWSVFFIRMILPYHAIQSNRMTNWVSERYLTDNLMVADSQDRR
jgi:hypothetical protein